MSVFPILGSILDLEGNLIELSDLGVGSVVLVSGLMVVGEIVAFEIQVVSLILTSDFTGDGLVNYDDFWDFVARYGTREGDANYSSRHDLTRDGADIAPDTPGADAPITAKWLWNSGCAGRWSG